MSQSPRPGRPSRRLWLLLASASALLMALATAWLLFTLVSVLRQGSPAHSPAATGAREATGAACTVQRSAPLAFRSAASHDTLRVRIEGAPCAQARLTIVLQGPDGAELYRYEAPFPPHLTAEEAAKPLPQAAEDFAASVIANAGIAGTTDALPPWDDAVAYYAEHRDAIRIDQATYQALRRVRRPIFWHATGSETWRSVVYDPQRHRGRVILAGGA